MSGMTTPVLEEFVRSASRGEFIAPSQRDVQWLFITDTSWIHAATRFTGGEARVPVGGVRPALALGSAGVPFADAVNVATSFEELCALCQRMFLFSPLVAHILAHWNIASGEFGGALKLLGAHVRAVPPPQWLRVHATRAVYTGGIVRADAWLHVVLFAVNFLDANPGVEAAGGAREPEQLSLSRACTALRVLLMQRNALGPMVPLETQRRLVLLLALAPGGAQQFTNARLAVAALTRTRAPLGFTNETAPHRLLDWRTLALGLSNEGEALRCFSAPDGAAVTATQLLERLRVPRRAARFADISTASITVAWDAAHQCLPLTAQAVCALRALGWHAGAVGVRDDLSVVQSEARDGDPLATLEHVAVVVPECDAPLACVLLASDGAQERAWTAATRFLAACGIAYRTHLHGVPAGSRAAARVSAPMVLLPRRAVPASAAQQGPAAPVGGYQPLCNGAVASMVVHTVLALQALTEPLNATDARTVAPLWDFACFVFQRFAANMLAVMTAEFARIQFREAPENAPLEPVALSLPWNLAPVRTLCAACCRDNLFPPPPPPPPSESKTPASRSAYAALEHGLAATMMALTVWVDNVRRVSVFASGRSSTEYDRRWWRSRSVTQADIDAAQRAHAATRPATACAVFCADSSDHQRTAASVRENTATDLLYAYWCAWATVDRDDAARQRLALGDAGGTILSVPALEARQVMNAALERVRAGMFCASNLDGTGFAALAYPSHGYRAEILDLFRTAREPMDAWNAAAPGGDVSKEGRVPRVYATARILEWAHAQMPRAP